jgi:hypothetical protein
MLHILEFPHLRDLSVSASKVERGARERGLACTAQEIHTWLTRRTQIDCFSTLVRRDSPIARPNVRVRNWHFASEARRWRDLAKLYG